MGKKLLTAGIVCVLLVSMAAPAFAAGFPEVMDALDRLEQAVPEFAGYVDDARRWLARPDNRAQLYEPGVAEMVISEINAMIAEAGGGTATPPTPPPTATPAPTDPPAATPAPTIPPGGGTTPPPGATMPPETLPPDGITPPPGVTMPPETLPPDTDLPPGAILPPGATPPPGTVAPPTDPSGGANVLPPGLGGRFAGLSRERQANVINSLTNVAGALGLSASVDVAANRILVMDAQGDIVVSYSDPIKQTGPAIDLTGFVRAGILLAAALLLFAAAFALYKRRTKV